MPSIATALTAFVALSHFGFMALEMLFWDRPAGRKIFKITPEFSASSKALAANQGLYNGFLAAGLVWGVATGRTDVQLFFLSCVITAGVFGALTVKRSIFFIQALPALLAIIFVSV